MMHATTRRLSKIPEKVRAEIEPCFMENRFAFQQAQASSRITKINDETKEIMSSQLKVSAVQNICMQVLTFEVLP